MPEFFHKLLFQRRVLVLLLLFLFGFTVLGGFSLYVILLNGINALVPLRESVAWKCLAAGTLASFLMLIAGWIRIVIKRPGPPELAGLVESGHPDLREDLSTAVEIFMKQGGPRGPLEEALFRKVEKDTAGLSFRRLILPTKVHPLWFAVIVIGSLLLSDGAMRGEVMLKARYHALDRAMGESSGLTVDPGTVELPTGSDLLITARIERWEKEAYVEYLESGNRVRHSMTLNPDGLAQIRLYALENDMIYRVVTPSLASPDYTVSLYQPPVLHGIQINMKPPAYTRLEPQEFSSLLDLNVPAGSQLDFKPETDPGVNIRVLLDGDEIPLSGKVYAGGVYQLSLTNAEGRRTVTDRYRLQIVPDESPLVEIIEPGRDLSLNPRDKLPLRVYAADDYGLSAVTVKLSVSGLNRNPVRLLDADQDWSLEQGFETAIDLEDLGVEHGDVVVYFAEAGDNREPQAQVSRTEVFFIEISEEIEVGEPEDSPPEGDGQQQEVDFRALIVELKRLIRQSYATLALGGSARERENQAIASDLNALSREAREVLEQAAGMFFMQEAFDVFEVFRNSIMRLEEAEGLLNRNLTDESIAPQQEALSGLLVVESFFRSQSPQPSSGQGEPAESSASEGESSESEESDDFEQGPGIAEMREMLEAMNQLLAAQESLTQRFDRADRTRAGRDEMHELAKNQEEIERGQRELMRGLNRLREDGAEIRQEVRQAGREMERARESAGEGEAAASARSGLRAQDALLSATGLLESEIRRMAGRAVRGLANQASALSSRQGQAAGESRQADTGQLDAEAQRALEPEQRELTDAWRDLKNNLDRTAVEMNELFPDIARELTQAARNAENSQVEAEMNRAVNALLYERFDRAARSQETAAMELSAVADDLQGIASNLPQLSPGELRSLFERVMQARREAAAGEAGEGEGDGQELAAEARDQRQRQLGQQLDSAGEALGNQSLMEVGENLTAPKRGEGGTGGSSRTQLLDQAARILQEYLQSEWLQRSPGMGRPSAPAPEKYRQLVEEYFRSLVEEP